MNQMIDITKCTITMLVFHNQSENHYVTSSKGARFGNVFGSFCLKHTRRQRCTGHDRRAGREAYQQVRFRNQAVGILALGDGRTQAEHGRNSGDLQSAQSQTPRHTAQKVIPQNVTKWLDRVVTNCKMALSYRWEPIQPSATPIIDMTIDWGVGGFFVGSQA